MLTIRQRANGNWQAIVRVKRGGQIVYTESQTFEGDKAEQRAREWGERTDKHVATQGVSARIKRRIKLSELIGDYCKARGEARPLGRTVLGALERFSDAMGSLQLEELTSEAFVEFARARHRGGASPSTIMRDLAVARSALEAAKPMFGIEITGAPISEAIKALSKTGHVGPSDQRTRRPSADELEALDREFARVEAYPQTLVPMRVIVPLAIALPRRLGELCGEGGMRWEDYNQKIMVLRDTKHPKKLRTERVPVPPAARKIIDALPKIDARILPYRSGTVGQAFERACERLKIEDLRFHDLRHEGICRLFEQGLGIPEVSMISGHLSWQSLKRYTHLQPENVLEKLK